MMRRRVAFCCLCIILVGSAMVQAVSITLVAGSGYVVRSEELAVAIDAFTAYGTTAPMQEDMRSGNYPYDLDVILVTHSDHDHFDASLLAANMQSRNACVVVGPTEVLSAIRSVAPELSETRLIDISRQSECVIATGYDGLAVTAFSFPHPPNGSRPNFGYLLTLDAITLFHPGDLDDTMAAARFDAYDLASFEIDVAFLPYFMFLDSGLAEAISGLEARCLIPTHVRPMALIHTCRLTQSLFDSALCFRQLGEEIEYTEETVCGSD